MPAATPVITPVLAFTVAILVFEEEYTPPVVVELNVVVALGQTVCVPVKAFTVGLVFTVTVVLTESLQPLAFVTIYFITEVPAATGVTIPVEELMVATPVVALLHTPLAVALLNVAVEPIQILVVPVIGFITGKAFTVAVTLLVAVQPLAVVAVTV